MVNDVQEAIDFYTHLFGFESANTSAPRVRGCPPGPPATAARWPGKLGRAAELSGGRKPQPGGWNRLHFVVEDIHSEVQRLREAGVKFRNEIIAEPGGQQILLEDPSGKPIELFQPADRTPTT
jgi:catechol 2,3-dioxygenase-like lactoylglutathione lyase family enzyme